MILYHFTSINAWERIRKAGFLAPGESHVHPRKPGPPVVWLTTRDVPGGLGMEQNSLYREFSDFDRIDRQRVRITVDVAKTYTHKWLEWAPKHGGDPAWIAEVRRNIQYVGSWRVHTRPIPRDAFLACHDLEADTPLSIAPTPQQLGFRQLRPAGR